MSIAQHSDCLFSDFLLQLVVMRFDEDEAKRKNITYQSL